ncbi:Sec-independent protein translocase protein TatB [Sphingomonas sp. EC-HK361]|uniref:Sec-independent protein translocase protein TatB n=1 Tax=Sphingomonas sp. EC-HK361 TaxID=2038397 RepID=UPI001259BA1B|nr:Sec-independent protein translocase protein TatB [Sphingomonas sp. EC-HK361]VVT04388.1 Sec-independent protein translocase protein TatB [Sphingomonas sp. EC-HK361]
MLDFNPSELLLVAIVALVVIGPKDLPKAMRFVGQWVGKARAVGRQFRSGFDAMVREAELEEMEKRWKEENERIMREHPAEPAVTEASTAGTPASLDEGSEAPPAMTPKPDVIGGLVEEVPTASPDPEPQQNDRAPMLDLPMPPAPPAKP